MKPSPFALALSALCGLASAAHAQAPTRVELPSHALRAAPSQPAAAKPAPVAAPTTNVQTELRAVLGSDGVWRLACEQSAGDMPDSYQRWLDRLSQRKESIR
jgi:hypothetical protein